MFGGRLFLESTFRGKLALDVEDVGNRCCDTTGGFGCEGTDAVELGGNEDEVLVGLDCDEADVGGLESIPLDLGRLARRGSSRRACPDEGKA